MEQVRTSRLQQALDAVKELSPEEQQMLLDIVYRRFVEQRRADLAREIAAARKAYRLGQVRRGTVEDLMMEIAE
jgi:hypothetical protein